MKDDRYIDEDEILRTIIIIDLPNVDDVIDTITNIFMKYGKIDRIIIDKNEKTTDALIIYSNILSTEKAQFYPEAILGSDVIILKASNIKVDKQIEVNQTTAEIMSKGITAANNVKEYDENHYNVISKVGNVLSIGGNAGKKIMNKIDEKCNISEKTKPLFQYKPVKFIAKKINKVKVLLLL